uniref:Uncharacterized protein n=1 Tax=Lygus hesperus TaxID=30085 RepID=A0A0K8S3P0_LYGHE
MTSLGFGQTSYFTLRLMCHLILKSNAWNVVFSFLLSRRLTALKERLTKGKVMTTSLKCLDGSSSEAEVWRMRENTGWLLTAAPSLAEPGDGDHGNPLKEDSLEESSNTKLVFLFYL